MKLQPGTRLGPYEIHAQVGAGGMGEVYRARDTRLQRTVAIKVLPPQFGGDANAAARFAREARAISSLTHPNICALYDVGHEDGLEYLVMEFCGGKSLADRLMSGRPPLADAIRFGIEIGRALENAHQSGVIHRDIKPSNVMITASGVKLLDFGVAAGPFSNREMTDSDETHERLTGEGQIVGTAAYMAPEVLRGKPADERSDVFSFGLVLYEMIGGQRAFKGGDHATCIAQILDADPRPLSELVPNVSPSLDRLVRSCLAKDPDSRTQSAHDVRLQLEWLAEYDTATARVPVAPRRGVKWVAGAAGTVAVAAIAAAIWFSRSPVEIVKTPPPAAGIRVDLDLRGAPALALGKFVPGIGYFSPLLALSHDGAMLAYVGVEEGETVLVLRRIDSFRAQPVAGTRGVHHAFFSPDDRWIGFFVGDKVEKVPLSGGPPVVLAEVMEPIRGVWMSDGIYVMAAAGVGLVRVPHAGGPAVTIDRSLSANALSDLLPGVTHALIRGVRKSSGDFDDIRVLDLKTKESVRLVDRGYDARFLPPDHVVFMRGASLYRVGFDPRTRKAIGEPELIERGVASTSFWNESQYAVNGNGMIAFIPGDDGSVGKLAWIDRQGRTEFLPLPPQLYGVFTLSPDGTKLASELSEVANTIATTELATMAVRRLPIDADLRRPEWVGNDHLMFSMSRAEGAPLQIATSDLDARHVKPILQNDEETFLLVAAVPDGSALAAQHGKRGALTSSIFRPGTTWTPASILGGGTASFSPDGKWIAYVSPLPRGRQVVVAPADAPDHARQVSLSGGVEPLWCRACRELYYRIGAKWYAVEYSGAGESMHWSAPRLVWETDFIDTQGRSYDVSNDGKRLLVSKRTRPDVVDRIRLILRSTP